MSEPPIEKSQLTYLRAIGGAEIEQKENPALAGLKSKTKITTCGRYSPAASA
jgi:hypothetical protein